jgi:hypothetical protein
MHIFLNHNKVAIIGGYTARNMQISQLSKPIQSERVNEMQTSVMSLNAFTLALPGQFIGGAV